MKKFVIFIFLALLVTTVKAQHTPNIFYYYKGKKIFYPLSYDKMVIELKPGTSALETQKTIIRILGLSTQAVKQTTPEKQLLINLENSNLRSAKTISSLEQIEGVLYARPTFKTTSGKFNSYGKEFIVKLKSTTTTEQLLKLVSKNKCKLIKKYPFEKNIFILEAGSTNNYDGLILSNIFYETGLFEYAEPDKIVYNALETPPNDPLYYLQWALNNTGSAAQYNGTPGADMKIEQAWQTTMGASNIKVGVIDEGVDLTHPDLQANLLQGFNGNTMTSDPGDGAPLNSDRAHGTNCAGIIAAVANNNIGIAGVAPNCKIIPAVIFHGNGSYMGDAAVAASFDYVRLQGADIISNSYGGGGFSNVIDDAIQRALTLGRNGKGCLVFFSSGNNNADGVLYPANTPNVISVGGVSMCGQRKSEFSCDGEVVWGANYGSGLDMVAPSVKIFTTDVQGTGGYNTSAGSAGDYNSFNGTSSACPNAAGVAALLLSTDSSLTVAQATQILELSCDKLSLYAYSSIDDTNQPYGTWNNETGHGRVNAYAAIQMALSGNYCSVQISTSSYRFCNSSIILSVNNPDAAATYEWFKNGVSLGSGTTLTINSTGNYIAVMTKGSCTANSNILNIQNSFLLSPSALPDSICIGGSSQLSANAADNNLPYCSTSYSTGTTEGDYISLVQLVTTTLNNSSAGAASPYYTLYPASGSTTATVMANTQYTLNVSGGTWQECYIRGWIDYNQNGIFETTESIGISGNVGSLITGNIVFTIPANAINGTTKLRLRSSDDASNHTADNACNTTNSSYGETEDYIITITDGAEKFVYSWTENPIGATLNNTDFAVVNASNIPQPKRYIVNVTRANGCTATDSTMVSFRYIQSNTNKTDATCFGSATGSITVNPVNGTGPYTYRLGTTSTFGNLNSFAALKAGNYRISIRDAEGCTGITNQVTITQQPQLTGTFNNTNAVCFGTATGAIHFTPSTGTAPYNYRLGSSGVYALNNSFNNVRAGTYRLFIQDANGCIGSISTTITQPTKTVLTFTKSDLTCFGSNNGSITLSASGGTQPYNFRLGTSGLYNSNNIFNNLKPGNYRAYVQDANGCNGSSVPVSIIQSLDPCNPDGKWNTDYTFKVPPPIKTITLLPNPSNNQFTLQYNSSASKTQWVNIYDVNGRMVYSRKKASTESLKFGETFIPGNYFIEIVEGAKRQVIIATKTQ